MKFPRWVQRSRRKDAEAEALAALAAKIEANLERRVAITRDVEVTKQSAKLSQINHDNHFSAKLNKIFREGTT